MLLLIAVGGAVLFAVVPVGLRYPNQQNPKPQMEIAEVKGEKVRQVERPKEPKKTIEARVIEIRDSNREQDIVANQTSKKEIVNSPCENESWDLVIGILASPSSRSFRSREAIRKTWGRHKISGTKILVKFLLAMNKVC